MGEVIFITHVCECWKYTRGMVSSLRYVTYHSSFWNDRTPS